MSEHAGSPDDRLDGPAGDGDDQTLADTDQTLADTDQTQSDRDQTASDEDQASADWAVEHGGDEESYARTTSERAKATRTRDETSDVRDRTGRDRDVVADRRDEQSAIYDRLAQGRDEDAEATDAKDEIADRHTLRVEELRARGHATRARAAAERRQAARDREQAAQDRQRAADDRRDAAMDRELASTDDLTGARRRGVGLEDLEHEMERARRDGVTLVAAYVDVNGLKAVNDELGHPAGDAVLKATVEGLRAQMRSYDLIVRLGGDEFLCVLPKVGIDEARRRFKNVAHGGVSIGVSELRGNDSVDEFISRADKDLLEQRAIDRGKNGN